MTDEIWTTRDGRKIPVGEMGVEHLRNTLRMIIRNRRQMRERIQMSHGRAKVLALLLRPFLKEADSQEEQLRVEAEEKFFDELYNDVMQDHHDPAQMCKEARKHMEG